MPATPQTFDRPAYRPYRAEVRSITQLSPHFVRVSFSGPHFDTFADHARDQRIKIVFPQDSRCCADLGVDDEESLRQGDWYTRWRALPTERRSPFRTYTVRTIDQARRLLEVDFVVHQQGGAPAGPGSSWLHTAMPGDEVIIVGPDSRSPNSHLGMDWKPGSATDLLLLGDETAAPAIAGILERLPPTRQATALIEVPSSADALPIAAPHSANVRYLPRNGQTVGTLLLQELRHWTSSHSQILEAAKAPVVQPLEDVDVDIDTLWETPADQRDGGFYAWIAGESAAIKSLRRMLVTELGVDRRRVAFMGYWRQGRAEPIG